MRLRISALLVFFACGATSVAWGQALTSVSGPNLESMSYGLQGISPHNGPGGAKLGESTLLHAGIGAEVGYDSNVFYSPAGNRKGSGVVRVTPAIDISNAERDGTVPDGVAYDLAASMGYREYLTSDADIRKQRAFTPAGGLFLQFSSKQTLSLSVMDNFIRTVDPPYALNADPIAHDYNAAGLQLKVAPGGGRLVLTIRGNSVLDYYENEIYKNGSNVGNEGVLDIAWRWLPKTAFFVQAAQGVITYLHPVQGRNDSYPLRVTGGIRGLLTEKLALNLGAGYVNTFYKSGGSNPSGFNNVILFAEFIHKLSITQTAGIGYRHDVRNSPFVGDFYETHAVYAALRQLVGGRLALAGYGRFEYRNYNGHVTALDGTTSGFTRTDKAAMAGVTADVILARMLYVGVGYNLTFLTTPSNPPAGTPQGVDYTKHVVTGRLGLVY
jgi:hypothetical protein